MPECHKVTVIIISRNRLKMLERCLQSVVLAASKIGLSECKIIVGANGDSATAHWVEVAYQHNPQIEVLSWVESLTPAAARNRLLEKVEAGWIFFLDDDAAVGADYFSEFFRTLESSTTPMKFVGGPNINFKNCSIVEKYQEFALGSALIAGPFSKRYKPGLAHRTWYSSSLILCNLWIHKAPKEKLHFRDDLICAEENELFSKMSLQSEQPFFYFPALFVFHERRQTWMDFFRQARKFGYGRSQWMSKRIRGARFLMPILLVLCIAVTIISIPWSTCVVLTAPGLVGGIRFRFWAGIYSWTLHFGYCLGLCEGLTHR